MFAIEPSSQRGPQGGKPRGYCLAWRGRGFAPHGRSQRSGWYLHRSDAERAAQIANAAVDRDNARPSREAERKGDGSFLVRLVDPEGRTFWSAYGPHTPDGRDASRYVSREIAGRAVSEFFGHGPAFWESERASAARMREQHRGWKAEIVADADLLREG